MAASWLWTVSMAAVAAQEGLAPAEENPEPVIIVTGERVPRTLADTPSSVAVITDADLDSLAVPAYADQILAAIPNVQFGSGGTGPTIRGQDTTGVLRDLPAFLGGNRPRATVQVDGRALGYFEFVFGTAPVWDVAQIEVFRSPQTTTQGRNSIGGAVFIRTNDPTFDWEGRFRALAGNEETWQASAVASGPIVPDQVAFRVTADARRQRPSSDIADTMRGADPDHDDYGLVRAKLLVAPNALPGARLEASYAHLISQAPQIEGVEAPFRERRDPVSGYGVFRIRSDTATGRLTYEADEALTSATTLSWGHAFARRFAPPGLGEARTGNSDFSAESVLRWLPDGPVQLTGGVHHLRATLEQRIDLTALPFIRATGTFEDVQTSLGLFGEATLRPWPRVTFTTGLRYQRDTQDREGVAGPFRIDFDGGFEAWLPKVTAAYAISDNDSAGILVQRAFNPGGVTVNFFSAEADTFDAETLWNAEIFLRSSLAGGRLHAQANLFHNWIRNAQRVLVREINLPDGLRDFASEFANAPRARSYGAELQLDWRPSRRLLLSGAIGLLRTRILAANEPEELDPRDRLEGKEFARAPHFTAAASIEWRPVNSLRLSSQLRHNSGYFSDDANAPELRIEGATVIDALVSWTPGPVTLFGYARNIFDRLYITELFIPTFGTVGDPRELGAGFDIRF